MKSDLHARLDALAARIDKTRSELKAKEAWHDGHHLTAGELEAHGHRVSNLERSVRQWVDGLEL